MVFDIKMIKKVYAQFPERVNKARQVVGSSPINYKGKYISAEVVSTEIMI